MLIHAPHKGNTLSEYALILGLVALACIGSLSLFGNSTVALVGQASQGQHHDQMLNMSMMNFGNQQAGSTADSASASSGANTPQAVNTPAHLILLNTSGGGVNATSVDGSNGKVQTVQQALNAARAMQAKADATQNPALKAWYLAAARETFLLAGNEASLSYKMDNLTELKALAETNMTPGDALYEISNHYSMLGSFLLSLPPNITATEKSTALASVNNVLGSLKTQYADTLAKYTNMAVYNGQPVMTINAPNLYADQMVYGQQNYTKSPEDIQKLAPTALSDGSVSKTPAVQTSLETGLQMNSQ